MTVVQDLKVDDVVTGEAFGTDGFYRVTTAEYLEGVTPARVRVEAIRKGSDGLKVETRFFPVGKAVDVVEVTETKATDVVPGMHRVWNTGTSTITAVERTTPRSRTYRISYRSDTPRPDGHHNTHTATVSGSSWLPILTARNGQGIPDAPACPPHCLGCAATLNPALGLALLEARAAEIKANR